MQYLVNHKHISCCPNKHVMTNSYAFTLKRGRPDNRRHYTHPWIYSSRVGAWLRLFIVPGIAVYYNRWVWRPKPGLEMKIEWTRGHARLIHAIKNVHQRQNGHAHPHPYFSWIMAWITTNQASIPSKNNVVGIQRTACHMACPRAKTSRLWWTFDLPRKRVRQHDQKLGFYGLRKSRLRA